VNEKEAFFSHSLKKITKKSQCNFHIVTFEKNTCKICDANPACEPEEGFACSRWRKTILEKKDNYLTNQGEQNKTLPYNAIYTKLPALLQDI